MSKGVNSPCYMCKIDIVVWIIPGKSCPKMAHMNERNALEAGPIYDSCLRRDWMFEGWRAWLQNLRTMGWYELLPIAKVRFREHMEKALMVMEKGRVGGYDGGHKDLCPKPSKLLVSDDVQEVLENVDY